MLKDIIELAQQVFTLARDMKETKEQIKELRSQVNILIAGLQAVQHELELVKRDAAHDKEVIVLRLEKALLTSGIVLPPPTTPAAPKIEHKRRQ